MISPPVFQISSGGRAPRSSALVVYCTTISDSRTTYWLPGQAIFSDPAAPCTPRGLPFAGALFHTKSASIFRMAVTVVFRHN